MPEYFRKGIGKMRIHGNIFDIGAFQGHGNGIASLHTRSFTGIDLAVTGIPGSRFTAGASAGKYKGTRKKRCLPIVFSHDRLLPVNYIVPLKRHETGVCTPHCM
jgi:hypothetical protein